MPFTDPNYTGPKTDYLRYKEAGKHIFRFMGDILTFNRYWKDQKPWIFTERSEIPSDADKNDKGKLKIDHVWAVIAVRKDDGKAVACGPLEIPHGSLQKALMDYYDDPDFGDFLKYDIVITRKGTGRYDTKYSVIAKPPKPPTQEALDLYNEYEPKDLTKSYCKEVYNNKGEGIPATTQEVTEQDLDDVAQALVPEVDFDKLDDPKEEKK